jgi:hypothetical protein
MSDAWVVPCQALSNLVGSISASIFSYDYTVIVAQSNGFLQQCSDDPFKEFRLVVGRNRGNYQLAAPAGRVEHATSNVIAATKTLKLQNGYKWGISMLTMPVLYWRLI